jgi:hypothetical protein
MKRVTAHSGVRNRTPAENSAPGANAPTVHNWTVGTNGPPGANAPTVKHTGLNGKGPEENRPEDLLSRAEDLIRRQADLLRRQDDLIAGMIERHEKAIDELLGMLNHLLDPAESKRLHRKRLANWRAREVDRRAEELRCQGVRTPTTQAQNELAEQWGFQNGPSLYRWLWRNRP